MNIPQFCHRQAAGCNWPLENTCNRTINEERQFGYVLICTNKDAKLLTTGHDLDCANQQINKPFSSQRALNEWKPQYSKKVLYKEAKQSLWIWNEIRSYQVIWKSNDQKNQCIQQQAASETTKAEEKRHQFPNKTPWS